MNKNEITTDGSYRYVDACINRCIKSIWNARGVAIKSQIRMDTLYDMNEIHKQLTQMQNTYEQRTGIKRFVNRWVVPVELEKKPKDARDEMVLWLLSASDELADAQNGFRIGRKMTTYDLTLLNEMCRLMCELRNLADSIM